MFDENEIVNMLVQPQQALPSRFHLLTINYFSRKVEVIFCPNNYPVSVVAVVYWDGIDDVWEKVIRFIQFEEAVGSGVICLQEDFVDFEQLPKEMRKAILREIGYHYYRIYEC